MFIIIGSVHLDPQGPELLKTALEQLMPSAVTIDVSRYAVRFRREKGPELLARLEPFRRSDGTLPASLEAVEAQIAMPFEVSAVESWCKIYDKEYHMLGDDNDSIRRLELFETELMSPENLSFLATRRMASLTSQARLQWEKARAGRMNTPSIRGPLGLIAPPGFHPVAAEPCDERIAGLLRTLLPQSDRMLHVTGWEHLPPLADLLADFSPFLRLLDEFSRQ
ncbi:MAG TPA: hypothetical protein PKM25_16890 [Candidatus Ozemobacteraceae bacterium]|nr:hypothetical protein [Candidatus Ozemobacteraceae bacterium]